MEAIGAGSGGGLGLGLETGAGLVWASGWLLLLSARRVLSCLSIPVSVSVSGRSGEFVLGFWRAMRMSAVAALIMSAGDAVGSLTFCGNQSMVDAFRSLRVLVM